MNESTAIAVVNIENAIERFQKSQNSGVLSTGNILKRKTVFLSEIKEDVTLLKSAYSKASDNRAY